MKPDSRAWRGPDEEEGRWVAAGPVEGWRKALKGFRAGLQCKMGLPGYRNKHGCKACSLSTPTALCLIVLAHKNNL